MNNLAKKLFGVILAAALIMAILFITPLNTFARDERCLEGDCRNGKGKFEYDTGIIYEGEWKNGKEHGYGVMKTMEGTYEGSYKNGQPNGQGVFTIAGGRKYIGEWKNGLADGHGLEVYPNGNSYEGSWRAGLPNGYGATTAGGAEQQVGYWIDGEYVGSDRPWNID